MSTILPNQHLPVMLNECLQALNIVSGGTYVDATFGRGGHSKAILELLNEQGRLIAFDQDAEAVEYAKEKFSDESRFVIVHKSFTCLQEALLDMNITSVDGVLFDFGVSSPQLDQAERGFSFNKSGPLDMRMNQASELTAEKWLNEATMYEIADVLRIYGEENFSKRIATRIVEQREKAPLNNTLQLAEIVSQAIPEKFKHGGKHKGSKKHPATRTFQAIRIFINQELAAITEALPQAVNMLGVGGRLVVMSFHSLEDRLTKRFMAKHSRFDEYPADLPVQIEESQGLLKLVGKKQTPGEEELSVNPRARSVTLRVAEKNREGMCHA